MRLFYSTCNKAYTQTKHIPSGTLPIGQSASEYGACARLTFTSSNLMS